MATPTSPFPTSPRVHSLSGSLAFPQKEKKKGDPAAPAPLDPSFASDRVLLTAGGVSGGGHQIKATSDGTLHLGEGRFGDRPHTAAGKG